MAVCVAFSMVVSEAKGEIMCMRSWGVVDATGAFTGEVAGQVDNQTHDIVYLGGSVDHDGDLSIKVDG